MGKRVSFHEFPETCPQVDAIGAALTKTLAQCASEIIDDDDACSDMISEVYRAVDASIEEIKQAATYPFRDALEDACTERNELRAQNEQYADQVYTMTWQINDLEKRIRELENEIDKLEREAQS